jgi:hypothetical protein
LYQKKDYARGDNQDENSEASEEECELCNEDYWQIDMTDGDEIDDI